MTHKTEESLEAIVNGLDHIIDMLDRIATTLEEKMDRKNKR